MSYLFFCYLRQDTCLIPNSGMRCSNKSQHFFLYNVKVNNGFLMKVVMWSMMGSGTKPSPLYRQTYWNGSTYSKKKDFRKCWDKKVLWRPLEGKWHHYRKFMSWAIFPMVGCDGSSYRVICVLLPPGLCHSTLLVSRPWPDIAKHKKQWHLVNQNYINVRILLILPPQKI